MEKHIESTTVLETGLETTGEKDASSIHPPMTFKRFMVLLSLIWLIVTSATPILFITAALGDPPSSFRHHLSCNEYL